MEDLPGVRGCCLNELRDDLDELPDLSESNDAFKGVGLSAGESPGLGGRGFCIAVATLFGIGGIGGTSSLSRLLPATAALISLNERRNDKLLCLGVTVPL